jgi:5-methylcytosine-specific restriction endonuclease McrA
MFEPDEDQIKLERNKARELRKSQWWKNRVGRGECYYCDKQFPPKELTLDHIVPVSRGGRTTKGNCVPCCKECNNRKQALTPVEWDEFVAKLENE